MSKISAREIKRIQDYADKHFKIDSKGIVTMNDCYITQACIREYDDCEFFHLDGKPIRIDGVIRVLVKHNVSRVESYKDFDTNNSRVACIGFSNDEQGWLGWSHRAYNMFKVGYVVHKDSLCTSTGWVPEFAKEHPERCHNLPVGFKCKNLDDCRKAAIAFAMAVA